MKDKRINYIIAHGYDFFEKIAVPFSDLPVYSQVQVPNFGGCQGRITRVGGDNSIQFINFGRVGDKSFKEW